MKTNNLPEEVLVLRFFESGPIEKVEAAKIDYDLC